MSRRFRRSRSARGRSCCARRRRWLAASGSQREAVARRAHWSVQQRVISVAHPCPELIVQALLNLRDIRLAGEVALLEGILVQVVQLHHAGTVPRITRGVGTKDGP